MEWLRILRINKEILLIRRTKIKIQYAKSVTLIKLKSYRNIKLKYKAWEWFCGAFLKVKFKINWRVFWFYTKLWQ